MHRQTFGRSLPFAVMAITLAALLAACSQGASGTPAASAPGAAPASAQSSAGPGAASAATIKNFAFSPASVTVAVGSTVTWTNQDAASHTVTADDGSFDSKVIGTGASFSETFSKAGTYTYHCSIHKSMTATVVVQ
jgi:plastocyanin